MVRPFKAYRTGFPGGEVLFGGKVDLKPKGGFFSFGGKVDLGLSTGPDHMLIWYNYMLWAFNMTHVLVKMLPICTRVV